MSKQENAETIALRALAWIAGEEDMLAHFLNATGAASDDLTGRVHDGNFLASVLDFLLMEDAWVVAFCEAEALDFRSPAEARAALPGGDVVHWT